jgi:hypothetical protein
MARPPTEFLNLSTWVATIQPNAQRGSCRLGDHPAQADPRGVKSQILGALSQELDVVLG